MLKNLKKVISTIAAVAILATSASAFAVTFPDVDESASYAGAVELLTALGVVNGDDNGKFNPDNTVTRAELAKMVVEALGQGEAASKSSYTKFADAQGHWAAGYIEAGVAAEFINGYDENTFGPDDTVTYAQAVKMLVGAAGYEAWAQQAGGWTAGYMSYGSSLGITAGVKGVTNDTALTRAQCAVLIANAMKAPLLVTDGYNPVGTMNGVVMVPNYVQKDDYGKEWQTMLTEYHNAYDVKGRVTATAKTSACEKDEVMFAVEDARNIDNAYVEDGNWTVDNEDLTYPAKAVKYGTTKAADMMFEYASAVLVKDEDTNEFSIAYIEPYGATKTLELSAESVRAIDADYAYVLKSEMSDDTKKYDLDSADIYVNGYKLAPTMDGDTVVATVLEKVVNYIADNNKFGTVTLVDESEAGSTVTDGDYDAIMITYTVSDMVSYTRTTSTANEIVLESGKKLTYDPEDEDVSVVFVKDGAEIKFEDLEENDVLTITKNVEEDLAMIPEATIVVTNNTVAGTVTRTGDNTVVVDGAEYDIADDVAAALTKEYTFFLDANGVIVASKLIATNINYGIITRAWFDTDAEAYKVTVVTGDGEVVSYEVKDADAWTAIKAKLGTAASDDEYTTAEAKLNVANSVVQYKISGGKFKLSDTAAVKVNDVTTNLEYRASSTKLAGYTMDDATTKILDVSAFLDADGKASDVAVMTTENFEDELTYSAYIYDKNDNGAYQFVVVTDGTNSLRPTSALAMVKKYVGTTQVSEETVREYVVLKNGEEVALYVEGGEQYAEGTIVMAPNSAKGYVEAADVIKVYTPATSYNNLFNAVIAEDAVFAAIDNAYITGGTLDVNGAAEGGTDTDVKMYAGIAVSANINSVELIQAIADMTWTDVAEDGTESIRTVRGSEMNTVKDFNINGANIYTYNYDKTADKGYRVENAAAAVGQKMYKAIADADFNAINWSDALGAEVCGPIVIMREVDNDITDVFYFVAE